MKLTNKEAIANLNHIYGIVSPDIQRSLDLAIKALEERPKGKWEKCQNDMFRCSNCRQADEVPTAMGAPIYNFCPNCGAEMQTKEDNPCPCIECTTTDFKGDCQYCKAWAKWSLE